MQLHVSNFHWCLSASGGCLFHLQIICLLVAINRPLKPDGTSKRELDVFYYGHANANVTLLVG